MDKCTRFCAAPLYARWNWACAEHVCFCCLLRGHSANDCKAKKPCGEDGCESSHHRLLHRKKQSRPEEPAAHTETEATFSGHGSNTTSVLLRILPVTVSGPSGRVETFALLDEGSTATLLDAKIARQIGATGETAPLVMRWTDCTERQYPSSQRVTVSVSGIDGPEFPLSARTVDHLDLPTQSVSRKLLHSWCHLRDSRVAVMEGAKPTVLIGTDNAHLSVAREVVEGPPNAPMLTKTRLGWVVHGKADRLGRDVNFTLHGWCRDRDEELHQLVKSSFSTDAFGVSVRRDTPLSKHERRAEEIMLATTRRADGTRWQTGLLWKEDDCQLPPSKAAALSRLYSLERKMDRLPDFADQYSAKINEYVTSGFAGPLSEEEAASESPSTWYLPHFAVWNPNKPGKLRLVFDAAAKAHGSSLNDHLLPGPDLLNPLVSVLYKFRQRRVAFGGDIRSMFHMVKIQEEDQSAQRFLWRGMGRARPPTVYQMNVMTFGATCSPSSAQFVMRRNAEEFREEFPDAEVAIKKRHYMDDYFDSTDTEGEAAARIRDVITVHARGGFEIRNWVSNSPAVLPSPPAAPSKSVDIGVQEKVVEKTLGLRWDTQADNIVFVLSPQLKEYLEKLRGEDITKRQVLKLVMSLFDPIGLLACFTVGGRIILQHIWRSGIGWDDPLPSSLRERWETWWERVRDVERLQVPRCYLHPNQGSTVREYELHTFCDASEEAFAAVSYLRSIFEDGSTVSSLVAAKTRVAPLKPMTIPRLELQAAVLGSRLARSVNEQLELKIAKNAMWTDSRTVLQWLRMEAHHFKPFVAHRVVEISELIDVERWNWVSTTSNPADLATRGKCPVAPDDPFWLQGPRFLRDKDEAWPEADGVSVADAEFIDCELKKDFVNVISAKPGVDISEALPAVKSFSSWTRLISTTACVLMFVRLLKERRRNIIGLRVAEVRRAQTLWERKCQEDCFSAEITALRAGKPLARDSRLLLLSPMIDDGLLKVRGRTENAAAMPATARRPVILDPDHEYTRLLLQQYHRWHNHHGKERMLNDIRQRHWILRMRSAVKKTWAVCQRCKNERAEPRAPEMGQLPSTRLTPYVRPFAHTGVDYFGPVDVTVGRRREKRYGVIFTCLTVRAVPLEIASSLTTDSCILAVRRFIARRGYPVSILSDNGTNFHGAQRELAEALQAIDHQQVAAELVTREIEWKFNPPAAPTWVAFGNASCAQSRSRLLPR